MDQRESQIAYTLVKYQQDCNRSFGTKDLDYLEDDVSVFKLIGPDLLKKDTPDAKITVVADRRYP